MGLFEYENLSTSYPYIIEYMIKSYDLENGGTTGTWKTVASGYMPQRGDTSKLNPLN